MSRPSTCLSLVALLALTSACSDGGTDDAAATPSPSASASSAEPAPPPTCEPFAAQAAQALVLDAQRADVPPVSEAVSVQTRIAGEDAAVYVLAFDLGGKSIVLAHPVAGDQGPTGNGPYLALSSYTAEVTGAPQDDAVRDAVPGDAVSTAIGCLSQ
jgi:hypothetical protein